MKVFFILLGLACFPIFVAATEPNREICWKVFETQEEAMEACRVYTASWENTDQGFRKVYRCVCEPPSR